MVVIAISGKPVSGSSSAAKALAKKLKIRHVSGGDFFKSKAREHGIKEKETRTASKFLASEKGGHKDFHKSLDDMLIAEGKKGNAVIEGKLCIKMLKGIYDLSVWIEASDSVRAQRISQRDGIPIREAVSVIEERDKTERDAFKRIYGFDTFSQAKSADLIINSGMMNVEEIVDFIISKMRARGLTGNLRPD